MHDILDRREAIKEAGIPAATIPKALNRTKLLIFHLQNASLPYLKSSQVRAFPAAAPSTPLARTETETRTIFSTSTSFRYTITRTATVFTCSPFRVSETAIRLARRIISEGAARARSTRSGRGGVGAARVIRPAPGGKTSGARAPTPRERVAKLDAARANAKKTHTHHGRTTTPLVVGALVRDRVLLSPNRFGAGDS